MPDQFGHESLYYLHSPKAEDAIARINIEASSACNLNCSICFRHGWTDRSTGMLDMRVFASLAEQMKELPSVKEVCFGGMGEPLFHPHITDMISAIPADRKKMLITNGTLLDRQMSERLLQAGLNELWLSMDGFDPDSYEHIQTGGHFRLIMRNLEAFNEVRKDSGLRLFITFVVTPDNVSQLGRINAFADSVQASGINISHMIPSYPLSKSKSIYDRQDISVGKMRRYKRAEPLPEHTCPFLDENQVFVRWDGAVVPCMQLLHGCTTYLYDERRTITSFTYGNVGSRTLMECWNDPEYREFRLRVQTFYFPFCTICWGCEDRKENLYDCFLGRAPTCGACLWSTGKIRCP